MGRSIWPAFAQRFDAIMPAQPKTPVRKEEGFVDAPRSSGAEVDAFLARLQTIAPVSSGGRGRLIFAMDATMSRQPTWDLALGLQAEMFRAVKEVGFRPDPELLEVGVGHGGRFAVPLWAMCSSAYPARGEED
jgi:hypothetical protein